METKKSSLVRRLAAAFVAVIAVVVAVAWGPELLARVRSDGDDAPSKASPAADNHAQAEDGHDDEGHVHEAHRHENERADDDHAEHDHERHDHEGEDHEAHDHAEHDHDEAAVLELTPQALKNIAYKPHKVAKGDYERTISLPGMVVERPGRTQLHVAAPLGGVVTRVHVIEGEAVAPETPLFDVRLTHEELVSAQGAFLKSTEELDVVNREIARLEGLTEGVVAGSRVRDQRYERQKLEAQLRAQRQALLLHGLSQADVDGIVSTRQLLQSLTIRAPQHEDDCECAEEHLFHVQELSVERGEQVEAGAPLAVLADHCELYIEGTAFEEDAERLRQAAADGVNVSADLLVRDRRETGVEGLKILYLADQIEPESRALHFYLPLLNTVTLDRTDGNHRFIQWRFKPGQRVELRVPVERWAGRLVLPAEAVVSDGAEAYVFVEEEPRHFYRTPVHVLHKDQRSAVIEDDGAVHEGDTIAATGAFQMHLVLKNNAGGGVDPHAGHSH
jgi:cobalt-zinc-cadmium efflux system membrane fusion protein